MDLSGQIPEGSSQWIFRDKAKPGFVGNHNQVSSIAYRVPQQMSQLQDPGLFFLRKPGTFSLGAGTSWNGRALVQK